MLNAGALDAAGNYLDAECMARYIEDALPPSPPLPPGADATAIRTEKRKFLVGLSTGIIEYLKAHDTDSFRVMPSGLGASVEIT